MQATILGSISNPGLNSLNQLAVVTIRGYHASKFKESGFADWETTASPRQQKFGLRRCTRFTRTDWSPVTWMEAGEKDNLDLLMVLQLRSGLTVASLIVLAWTSSCLCQTPAPTSESGPEQQGASSISEAASDPALRGTIRGTVVDQTGALVSGARVTLTRVDSSLKQEMLSGADGQFSFANVSPGTFQLITTAKGFAVQTVSGILHPGEIDTVPQIVLTVAANVTEVQVGLPQVEVAEEQIKVEEKQRVLGAIPNYYVSYTRNPAPLNPRQKFELAARTVVDPFTFVVVAGTAGVQQAQNHFREYGQGAQGYAKRFGAVYADTVSGTFIGGAVLPALLKQDPRYFYKGTGSTPSRFLYAIANAVICKGDNGRWQPNYSNILGSMAAGGISNLYYPSNDREGIGLTFENAAVGIASTAITNVLQEFLIRKLTPKTRKANPSTP